MRQVQETTILLVEDNAGDARLIQEMLRGVPEFQVQIARTLLEASAAAQAPDCDLVLLDLSLPDSQGMDTVNGMRRAAPGVPLLVLTGLDDVHLGMMAVQAGAQDFLIKGDTDSRTLQRAIRYAGERHRVEQALRRSEQEYRSLIDDVFNRSSVGVLILDRSFTVVWVNDATVTYFGVARADLIGHDKRELIRKRLACLFSDSEDYERRLLLAYETNSFNAPFECLVTAADNRSERWLEHWSQPIHEGLFEGGRIEQYTDITVRKRAEIAEMEQRRFAEALRGTAEALISALALDDVLEQILTNVDQLVPNDGVSIVLRTDEGVQVIRSRGSGTADHEPIIRLSAPIVFQQDRIGYINVYSRDRADLRSDGIDRLRAFASQAAIAIQNARQYHQSQELATIQERQRLARELHDSVSQTLFSSQTIAEAALRQWSANPSRARELIEEVMRLLGSAVAEMRVLLLELRPSTLTQAGLSQLFEQNLKAALSKQSIDVRLEMDDLAPLPPDVQIALYRIVQEAINNVIKHADATSITVRGEEHDGVLSLSVCDDGRGFVPSERLATSMGLDIMRERAQAIGATLDVETGEGAGTRIIVTWMRQPERQES